MIVNFYQTSLEWQRGPTWVTGIQFNCEAMGLDRGHVMLCGQEEDDPEAEHYLHVYDNITGIHYLH